MFPSQMFKCLYEDTKQHWEQHVRGDDSFRRKVWTHLCCDGVIRDHPLLQDRDVSRGGSFNKQESAFVFAWNSLSVSGEFRAFPKKTDVIPHATFDAVFGAVAADFTVLARGTDANSIPLADGWSAVLVDIRGGWECSGRCVAVCTGGT